MATDSYFTRICALQSTVTMTSGIDPRPHERTCALEWERGHGYVLKMENAMPFRLSWILDTKSLTPPATIRDEILLDLGQNWTARGVRRAVQECLDLILTGKVRIP